MKKIISVSAVACLLVGGAVFADSRPTIIDTRITRGSGGSSNPVVIVNPPSNYQSGTTLVDDTTTVISGEVNVSQGNTVTTGDQNQTADSTLTTHISNSGHVTIHITPNDSDTPPTDTTGGGSNTPPTSGGDRFNRGNR